MNKSLVHNYRAYSLFPNLNILLWYYIYNSLPWWMFQKYGHLFVTSNTSILITRLLPMLSLHFLWRLPTLFSKYYNNISPKKNLFIHVIFYFCYILNIKILHKTKTMRLYVDEKTKHQLVGTKLIKWSYLNIPRGIPKTNKNKKEQILFN